MTVPTCHLEDVSHFLPSLASLKQRHPWPHPSCSAHYQWTQLNPHLCLLLLLLSLLCWLLLCGLKSWFPKDPSSVLFSPYPCLLGESCILPCTRCPLCPSSAPHQIFCCTHISKSLSCPLSLKSTVHSIVQVISPKRNPVNMFHTFFFWLCCSACEILVPWPEIEPSDLAGKVPSPNHWTARELQICSLF